MKQKAYEINIFQYASKKYWIFFAPVLYWRYSMGMCAYLLMCEIFYHTSPLLSILFLIFPRFCAFFIVFFFSFFCTMSFFFFIILWDAIFVESNTSYNDIDYFSKKFVYNFCTDAHTFFAFLWNIFVLFFIHIKIKFGFFTFCVYTATLMQM